MQEEIQAEAGIRNLEAFSRFLTIAADANTERHVKPFSTLLGDDTDFRKYVVCTDDHPRKIKDVSVLH